MQNDYAPVETHRPGTIIRNDIRRTLVDFFHGSHKCVNLAESRTLILSGETATMDVIAILVNGLRHGCLQVRIFAHEFRQVTNGQS